MIIIDEELLDEFRHKTRCEVCGKRIWTGLDPHHIFAKGLGGGSQLDIRENLISLCRWCHSSHHAGHNPTRKLLLLIAAKRENCAVEEIIAKKNRLLQSEKFNHLS
jgi:hypothetical protein